MAIPSSLSAGQGFLEALKKVYSPKKTTGSFTLRTPWFKSLKKIPILGEGQNYTWSVALQPGSGFGNSTAAIIANSTQGDPNSGATTANFVLNTGDDYAVMNLDNKFLARSKSPGSAFASQLMQNIDRTLEAFGIFVARKAAGDGSGKLANISSTTGTVTSMTLSSARDSKYFFVGMRLQGADASYNLSAVVTVTAVNTSTGVISFSSTNLGSDNYIYVGLAGVIGAASLNAVGLAAYIPLSVGSNTRVGVLSSSLVNCSHNRATYPQRLAGHRLTGETSKPVDELMYKLASTMQEMGAMPDVALMSFNTYNKIAQRQWTKIVPIDKDEAAELGLKPMAIATGYGQIPFMADSTIDDDKIYLLRKDTWGIAHLSSAIPEQVSEATGSGQAFQLTDDAIQLRWRAWWNLVCEDPFQNGVVEIDSTSL